MSYDIYIGEAVIDVDQDPEYGGGIEALVQKTTHPEAPVFVGDDMTGNSNARHPGYGQWSEWCRAVGLHTLFFDKEHGLMRQHPGCVALKPMHLDAVRAALDKWKTTHTLPPGWDDPPAKDASAEEWTKYETGDCVQRDPMLARLIWLEWWMRWALGTCKTPAIYNR